MVLAKTIPPVGASPGTLSIAEGSPPPKVRAILYNETSVQEHQISDLDELASIPHQPLKAWIDVQGTGDEEVLRRIGSIFSLHRLVLEDIVSVPQRPKSEAYDHHHLLITRMLSIRSPDTVEVEQVSIVIGANYVLTFQERYGDILDPVRNRLRKGPGLIRSAGPDYLAHGILDTVIDGYYPVLEALGDQLERLEDRVMLRPTAKTLEQLTDKRHVLLQLRRTLWPQREAVQQILRDEHPMITNQSRVYFRDTLDHCVQVTEVTESYRELIQSLMNTYLSMLAQKTNEVMRVLTIIATIFIPLTFLTSVYGMNFHYMPELSVRWAYPLLLGLMAAVGIGMLVYFRRRGWLGSYKGDEDDEAD
ncbi:MAG: magnesium/cobalt transporter CorA [Myxococcales bacterium]|nr:magnesium/cobalt transporter CorA [Myxococcales bacterium]